MPLEVKGREAALGFAWIYGILSTDSTLQGYAPGGVWRSLAQPDTQTPFVVVSYQSSSDTVAFGAVRVVADLHYQVKVVAPANLTAQSANAAQRVDQLLDGAIGQNIPGSNGLILSCYRQTSYEFDELVTGQLWTNLGGDYLIMMAHQ